MQSQQSLQHLPYRGCLEPRWQLRVAKIKARGPELSTLSLANYGIEVVLRVEAEGGLFTLGEATPFST